MGPVAIATGPISVVSMDQLLNGDPDADVSWNNIALQRS